MKVEEGPLTGHKVRYDGRDALCGSMEDGCYRIRFERTGHSLLVRPSKALEDLGVATLYIDSRPKPIDKSRWIQMQCIDGCGNSALMPPSRPPETVRCEECLKAFMKAATKRRHEEEAARKAARKARHIPWSRREPPKDRSAFSKTYGSLSNFG